jgi:hypothetical protein
MTAVHAGQEGGQIGVDAGAVRAVHEVGFDGVGQEVPGRFTRVDVEAGDADRVVVIEHQPGAGLVGVVIGQDALLRRFAGIRHRLVDGDAL